MTDCTAYSKKLVPMIRCVNAAIIDSYEDIGKTQERYIFWAARQIKTLNRQILKANRRYALLAVNKSTNTATLPVDCDEITFVGVLDENNKKIPLKARNDLGNSKYEEIGCEDKCPKCGQSKGICNDMTITEDVKLVTINDSVYEQTVVKRLYSDGSYYLESKIPLWDIEAGTVVYTTTKELIKNISLKPCGCIEETTENIETIKTCCPDVYCCYYSDCNNSCGQTDYGGYKIFEQTGLIQFDKSQNFDKLYIEYLGFLPKKNGQLHVPEVAFETVVEYIKFMAVDGKRNISSREKQWRFERYRMQRSNMEKEIGRIGLSQILQAALSIPKFDIDYPELCGGTLTAPTTSSEETQDDCGESNVTATGTAECPSYTIFSISTIAGMGPGTPVVGTNIFQDSRLKGALGVVLIVVNNTNETIAEQQFTIDTGTGTITRYQADGVTPNNWFAGDVLIVPTFFKYS